MPQKLRDVVVKTGEYTVNGETKARWQNVGALMKSDDGGEFIILHRWFNPAGVPNPDNRDSLVLSCFKPQQQNGQGQAPQQSAPPQQQAPMQQPQGGGGGSFDDEIPFKSMPYIMGG